MTFGTSVQIISNGAFTSTGLTSATIPNTVTSIGINSFNNTQLTSLTLSNSITTIPLNAFAGTKLTSVSIPNSVTSIGGYAFENAKLTSVTIPNSVTSIGANAFKDNKLTSASISNQVTSIGANAFANNLLTTVTIPDSVTTLGDVAFAGNRITSVTFPRSITTIPRSLLASNLLASVTIPNTVTSIGDGAFSDNLLTSVTIGNAVTRIGAYAFKGNRLTDVTIPNSVTSIGDSAFRLNSIAALTIGNSVATIDSNAFTENLLTTVEIPNSVTTIKASAFGFNRITSLLIGSGVTSIEDQAFWMNQLAVVTFAGNAPTAGSAVFMYNGANFTEVKRFYSRTGWSSTWSGAPVVITVEATAKPYMTGTVAVGNTITANLGGWDGPATPTLATQWYACTAAIPQETQVVPSTCSAISDATASAFTVTAAESGKFIAVGVTASSAGATSATWLSSTFARVPPVNTVAPAVTGTASVYSTLTASSGTWTGYPAPTLAYQWLRCTAAGAAANTLPSGCATITGANQATYATDAADDQKYLRVQVTATNSLGSVITYSAATAKIAAFNTVAPVATGTASVYSTLTASSGTWTGDPAPTIAYQWLRCAAAGAAASTLPTGCATISGATQATYPIDIPDYQKYLRVQVTATNTLGSAVMYTAATAKIAGRITVNTVAPIVTGTTAINATLTGTNGTWTGAPVPTYKYQWLRCTRAGAASDALPSGCTVISGATRITYKLTTTEYGTYLRLKVVGTNVLGADTKYSAATAKIAGINPLNTVVPRITGTPRVGSAASSTPGTWKGFPTPTISYQWFRCTTAGSASTAQPGGCTAISRATGSTYTLVDADKTAGYLRLRVTGSSTQGRAVRFSAAVKVN